MVLKATLDAAGGENPLPSIIAAIFLLSITANQADAPELELWQRYGNNRHAAAAVELPGRHGHAFGPRALPLLGAVINFAQRSPSPASSSRRSAFLSLTGLLHLVQAMAA